MSSTSSGRWRTSWVCLWFLYYVTITNCEHNKIYYVSKLCGHDRPQPLYKAVDGAVLISEMDSDLNCTMTFQTESILQHFMVRFDELALDCGDQLNIFDGDLATGKARASLSCRNSRSEIGTIFTQSNFLTLEYRTDRIARPGDGFRLVITSYKDTQMGCHQFKCQKNPFCVSRDLTCDGVNHCGDGSDETPFAGCYAPTDGSLESTVILGIDFNIFIGIVLSVFVICLICVVNLIVCLCRSNQMLSQQHRIIHGQSTMNLVPMTGLQPQEVVMSPHVTRYATLPLNRNKDANNPDKIAASNATTGSNQQPPPYPGNGSIPASAGANNHHHYVMNPNLNQYPPTLMGISSSNNHLSSPSGYHPSHYVQQGHGHPHVIVTDNGSGNGVVPHVVYYTTGK